MSLSTGRDAPLPEAAEYWRMLIGKVHSFARRWGTKPEEVQVRFGTTGRGVSPNVRLASGADHVCLYTLRRWDFEVADDLPDGDFDPQNLSRAYSYGELCERYTSAGGILRPRRVSA